MLAWTSKNSTDLALSTRLNRLLASGWGKPLWWLASLLPAIWLVFAAATERLGANPAEALVRSTGDWAMRALCLALAVTPMRQAFGLTALARVRRMAGLFVYFYAGLHLLAYAWFDMEFALADIAKDIGKRPFILVGFLAWLMLTPMALTSLNAAVRWLGAKRWQSLHRLVFAVAGCAILHFFWMRAGKNDFADVAWYAALILVLLGWRLWHRLRRSAGQGRQIQRPGLSAAPNAPQRHEGRHAKE